MVDVISYGNFKPVGKHKNKKQIILCHSSREVEEYLTSFKFRYNKKFNKIPHFVIPKDGKILKLLEPTTYSNFLFDEELNKNSVIICLENLGWLEKKPLSNEYINWIDSIYNKQPFEKKWRDYFFWEPYTEQQVDSLVELVKKLCEELKINKKFIGHNTKVNGVKKYEGIVCRSNYDERFTDLSPSFDFIKFDKKLNYEQI